MGIPVTGGAPNYSASGANNTSKFIPEIWSGKLQTKFYDATVFGEIANTEYEGEIKDMGDKVYIRTRPDIVVNDYQKGMTLSYQQPERANLELDIDQAKYFAFEVKDVDKYQSDINLMNEFSEDGSEQVKIAVDTDILGDVFTAVDADNAGTTAGRISGDIDLGAAASPVTVTANNILDLIVDYGTILDEQNIPQTNRWIVMPAKMCALIKKSDLKDASLAGDGTSIMRNGRVGMVDRFTIYSSNLVNNAAGEYDVIFGHKSALTFAAQFTQMEDLPNPTDFGKLVRSLFVFGYEVIVPTAMGHSVISY